MRKPLILLALLSVAAIAASPASASAAPAKAAGTCPQFRVLHNDTISGVSFPAGPYDVVTSLMTCQQSTTYFQQFLAAGRVPSGWTVKLLSQGRRRFTKLGTKVDFQATPAAPATETSPLLGASGTYACPGTFRVLHNDRIGKMSLPAGEYQIALLSSNGMTCKTASNDFAYFLNNDWSGRLPSPWYTNDATKTFYRGSNDVGFRVTRVGGNARLLGSSGASTSRPSYAG
ncbi:MAG: hypothetical protein ACKOTA_02055 [Solirubrobacterales bacterium]